MNNCNYYSIAALCDARAANPTSGVELTGYQIISKVHDDVNIAAINESMAYTHSIQNDYIVL